MRRAGIINYICGYYILRVRDRAAFANLLLEQGIFTWNPVLHDGCVTLYMLRSEYSRMTIPDKIDVEVVREVGLPHLLHRYRHRPGIFAGLLLFIATLCISSMFIWNVEIEGAENIPEEEIIGKLEELGCGVGSFIPSIDFYALCNRYLASTGDVSWISVNMRGTVAYVELRERVLPEEIEKSDIPANIVAAADGIVQRIEVFSGTAAVKAGDPVEKGQLLISGVLDSQSVGFRAIRAQGKVIAQTSALIEVNIPLEITEKVYTGNTINEKTIKIFGKSINLFLKGRNLYEKCDTIEVIRNITLFDEITLPLALKTVTYTEYTEQTRTMTEDEASARAALSMSEEYAKRFAASEILSRTTESGLYNGAYRIICEVSVVEDIGLIRELGR